MNFDTSNTTNYPTETTRISSNRHQLKSVLFLKKVEGTIAQHYQDENFGLPELCQQLHLSRTQIYRKVMASSGVSPSQLIKQFRLSKAQELLQSTNLMITEVAYNVGFRDAGYFTKIFKEYFGYLPSEL